MACRNIWSRVPKLSSRLLPASCLTRNSPKLHRMVSLASHVRHSPRCLFVQSSQVRQLCTAAGQRNESIINIQDNEDFQSRVMNSQTPVVVDFHASWCGPCKLLGPRLETIILSKQGQVILAKVDVDTNSEIAMEYRVQSVPTVLGVKNGEVLASFIGLQEDDKIDSFVEKLMH